MQNNVGLKLWELTQSGRKGIAWLIDPDDIQSQSFFENQLLEAVELKIDFFFLGGSLIQQNTIGDIIKFIKSITEEIPVIIFPGNSLQFSPLADAILFLSLISGRNPDLLIGQHVNIAPILDKSKVEVLPTGYMLVDGGQTTSVHYISQTIPLPNHHPELAVATALAGHFLGLQYFYLDAGSGAPNPVSPEIIKAIKKKIKSPIFVGGGLNTIEKIKTAFESGADVVVIGNGAGKNPNLIKEAAEYLESARILSN
ncbi:geranylgeranylglyceryl/heptaprenylglyceryl phosphate synthase [Aquiflexum sp. TKW24L]|uniref:geranylgeranylglyceryl/heptaprenylglyceryl phosphate synthase n=1 Tax=Aquiflexum sp. TKW24L TaxID=2942212 RepID=UPI0020BE1821|nr:geranylgeranylglyceryl/heptaprenylglyceryl phosphate synthase [Aquiflexum sp. TKW24L]MCL6258901.1 geranylgeranylglyceryl/heptaprenylglyceryl phosphate synthase [Aquiflexum sp. TKW24L]